MDYLTATTNRLANVAGLMDEGRPDAAYAACRALLVASAELDRPLRDMVLDVAIATGRVAHGDTSPTALGLWRAAHATANACLGIAARRRVA